MLTKREVVVAKVETTYNTDATPGASDAILVENLSPVSLEGLRMHDRAVVKGTMGPKSAVHGGNLGAVSFDFEVKGSGTAGTAPETAPFFKAARFAETVVASTSVTYDRTSDGDGDSITFGWYEDGKLHKFTGAVVTSMSFNLEAGGRVMASCTVVGHYAESDTAIVTPTYDNTVPPVFVGASFAVGGYSAVINALSFDLGLVASMPPNPNAADGYGQLRITDFDVTGSFDPEDTLVATNDWLGDLQAGTEMALSTGTLGSTAGNQVAISMPAIAYTELSMGDRDGLRTREVSFRAVESSGDDHVSIALT